MVHQLFSPLPHELAEWPWPDSGLPFLCLKLGIWKSQDSRRSYASQAWYLAHSRSFRKVTLLLCLDLPEEHEVERFHLTYDSCSFPQRLRCFPVTCGGSCSQGGALRAESLKEKLKENMGSLRSTWNTGDVRRVLPCPRVAAAAAESNRV